MTVAQQHGQADMLSVETYLAEVLAAIRPLPSRDLGLDEAEGGATASDVTAVWPLPPFDNSSMDGYAVLAADVAAASPDQPVTLPVRAEVAAGDTTVRRLEPGTAIKIMTGALLPSGADAVVPVEWTDDGIGNGASAAAGQAGGAPADGAGQVHIRQRADPGHAVRRAGGDAAPGDLLLPAGIVLGPAQLAVLAASGRGRVTVRPRPRMVVISTGNELTEPGEPVTPGRIWESNSRMLAAAARQAGCQARRDPITRDRTQAVLAAIEDALPAADVLVTTGGVSMGGEHDAVKAALAGLGTVRFRKVAMQPGMPQGFGTVGEDSTPIFTLPGNPVSAFVSFQLFVRPAIRALLGLSPDPLPATRAVLTAPATSPRGRRSYLRGVLDISARTVTPASGQMSHQLASLARANALIVVPEDATAMDAGDEAQVILLP
jgi:molybdopterin molybdotransferase